MKLFGLHAEAIAPDAAPQEGGGIPSVPSQAEGMLEALMATGASHGQALCQLVQTLGADAAYPLFADFMAQGRPGDAVLDILDDVAGGAPETANAWLNRTLADGLVFEWTEDGSRGLHFDFRPWLTALPEGLRVTGMLGLHACNNLKEVPPDLTVGGFLDIRDCTRLERVANGFDVGGHAYLFGCLSLREVQGPLRVGGSLKLNGCAALTHLMGPIAVQKDCDLEGCDHLERLPEATTPGGPPSLTVGQCLFLRFCPEWDGRLPSDAQVGNLIFTNKHPNGVVLRQFHKASKSRKP